MGAPRPSPLTTSMLVLYALRRRDEKSGPANRCYDDHALLLRTREKGTKGSPLPKKMMDEPAEDWQSDDETLAEARFGVRRSNRARRRLHDAERKPADDERTGRARERPVVRRQRRDRPEEFRCRHCRAFVVPVPSGGRHRNHCPTCLHSRHVDERLPGDRLSACGGTMAPIGRFQRAGGEYMLIHRCMDCGVERHNRIAADDDFDLVLQLPTIAPHRSAEELESELA
jgi:hypothetical protein